MVIVHSDGKLSLYVWLLWLSVSKSLCNFYCYCILFICLGYIAWQGRYCALSYNSFSQFMHHVANQVTRQPCDVHDCQLCTAESHQDFNHIKYHENENFAPGFSSDSKGPTLRRSILPHFSNNGERSRTVSKKGMRGPFPSKNTTSHSSAAKVYSRHPHSKSASTSFENPFEEELIQEILAPKEKKSSGAMFPHIQPSPPVKPRRIRISNRTSPRRRTISAPNTDNSSAHSIYTAT